MTVADLIAALEALGPDARDLPVVYVDVDYGPADPEPIVEPVPRPWGTGYLGTGHYGPRWVRL